MGSVTRRIAVLGLVMVATIGAYFSCSSGGGRDDLPLLPGAPTFVTTLVLKDAAGAARSEFVPGEPVTLELQVRNRLNTSAAVQFPSGQQYDFIVLASGTRRVVWQWSRGRAFIQVLTEIVFAPGETRTFSVTWPQLDDSGQPVSPGRYEARGVLLFPEFASDPTVPHELGSTLQPLLVR